MIMILGKGSQFTAVPGHKRVGWKLVEGAYSITVSFRGIYNSSASHSHYCDPILASEINNDERVMICKNCRFCL